MSQPSTELRNELKTLIVETLRLENLSARDIEDSAPLWGDEGLGLDSIDALELVTALESRYGLKIADEDMDQEQLATVERLAEFIRSQTDQGAPAGETSVAGSTP